MASADLMSIPARNGADARQGMLSRLADAVGSLGRKVLDQGARMREVAALAPQAEEAALRARLFAVGCGGADGPWARALSGDIDRLSADASDLALRATPMAEAGAAHAEALARHAATLAGRAIGAAGLRGVLGPLIDTLESMAAHRRGQGDIGASLAGLAAQAGALAARAAEQPGGADGTVSDGARRIAGDLSALAAEVSRIATAIERDTGMDRTGMADGFQGVTALLPPPPFPPPPRSFGKAPVWAGVSRIG